MEAPARLRSQPGLSTDVVFSCLGQVLRLLWSGSTCTFTVLHQTLSVGKEGKANPPEAGNAAGIQCSDSRHRCSPGILTSCRPSSFHPHRPTWDTPWSHGIQSHHPIAGSG